jgi:hypothetical protein
MIGASKRYQDIIISPSRSIKSRVKFNGDTLLDDDKVISVSLNEIANSNETLTIGELNSAKATVQFEMPDNVIPLKNGMFSIQSGLLVDGEYEFVDKGTFYIDEIESSMGSKIVTVSGYDSVYRMNVEYEPRVQYPTSLENAINDICGQCNITHVINNIPDITLDGYQENITCKTFMGYCLGLMGLNGRMNESNKLIGYWFEDSGFKITWDNQFQSGFKLTTDDDVKISSVSCNGLISGNGYGISFENPYMTQEILDGIYKKVNGLTYSPSTVEWRGNPLIQVSDVVKVEDNSGVFHNVILSEHTIVLTGMKDSITCKGSNGEIVMSTSNSPTQMIMKRLYNTLTSALKKTSENILGHNGGYYRVDVNEEGFPSGWSIMNTPTLRDDTKMWKFTSGGLGYSVDGGKTFTKIAFDLEGNFSANAITTGTISGEMFELNLETGVIKIGERNNEGEISDPSFYLNEKGELKIRAFERVENKADEALKEAQGSVKKFVCEYASSTDGVTPPETGWSETAPTWHAGIYIWQRTATTINNTVTYSTPVCITGAKGEDSILLCIESSNGTTFKNSDVATIFTVNIYVGGVVIDNSSKLREMFGDSAYLQWLIKRHGETQFSKIPLDDSRLNDNGFMFTISAKDIKFKAVFNCELNV